MRDINYFSYRSLLACGSYCKSSYQMKLMLMNSDRDIMYRINRSVEKKLKSFLHLDITPQHTEHLASSHNPFTADSSARNM